MPFDGVTLKKILSQLEFLRSETLKQVYVPTKSRIYLVFPRGCVVANVEPGIGVLYLQDSLTEDIESITPFGLLLRKKLKGARLNKVEQRGTDRIVEFVFSRVEPSQELAEYRLIFELMGRNTNVLLVKDGLVVDALRRSVTDKRTILPGAIFEYYPSEGLNFFTSEDAWLEKLKESDLPLEKSLMRVFTGISRLHAQEIVTRSGLDFHIPCKQLGVKEMNNLIKTIEEFRREFESRSGLYLYKNPPEISPVKLLVRNDKPMYFDNPSEAVLRYLKERFGRVNIEDLRSALTRAVKARLKSRFSLLEKLEKELEEAEHLDKLKKQAELIFANSYRFTRKLPEVQLYDWETQSYINIKLDPSLTPVENATKMMRSYSKLKRRVEIVKRRIEEVKREVNYLESLMTYVELAENESELKALKEELEDQGILRAKDENKKTHRPAVPNPGKRFSFKGFTIIVGRNNRENDRLRREANPEDLWFHVRGVPGAHVFLKVNKEPPEDVKFFAARLAATFSRARYDRKVEVDVAKVRHLRKPPGTPPGYVLYDSEENLMVEPLPPEELNSNKEG